MGCLDLLLGLFGIGSNEALPINVEPPVIPTSSAISTPLVGTPGVWDNATDFTYQWQRNTGTWVDISGATNIIYTPTNDDVGYPLRLIEIADEAVSSASNETGNTAAYWTYTIDFTKAGVLDQFSTYNLASAAVTEGVGLHRNTRFYASFNWAKPTYSFVGFGSDYDMTFGAGVASPAVRVWINSPTAGQYIIMSNHVQGTGIVWDQFRTDLVPYTSQANFGFEIRNVSSIYTAVATFRKIRIHGVGTNIFA